MSRPGSKTYSFQIQPQEVDFQYRITLASLTNILLNAAGFNADDNGFGMRSLQANNSSWVLLSMAIEMDHYPTQYEHIKVETWIEDVRRAVTTRNFRITDADGTTIGWGCSLWAMINMQTRRAMDLTLLEGIHQFASGDGIPMDKPLRLGELEGEAVDQFHARYSHIDINNHVNSMRYVEWVSDCLSLDLYRDKHIVRFEINYLNEVLFNDEVRIFANEIAAGDYRFEIKKVDKTACRARIVLVDKPTE